MIVTKELLNGVSRCIRGKGLGVGIGVIVGETVLVEISDADGNSRVFGDFEP